MRGALAFLLVVLAANAGVSMSEQKPEGGVIPTATQWTLDAAGPTQRTAIRSVFLLYCPNTKMKGTGFLLKDGLVVTNAHVVTGCTPEQMIGMSSTGSQLRFKKMAKDEAADLALLRPSTALSGGLELGSDQDPAVGTAVSTWGFPLSYNGPPPLLSVGYVAGYSQEQVGSRTVKHVVVNGAFNPGNSGGPLFRSNDDKVIGVVVAKFHLYPPYVEQAITTLANTKSGLVYTGTDEHGNRVERSEAQVLAMILEQFYRTTQVMIGQAISVSELKAFIASKQRELQQD